MYTNHYISFIFIASKWMWKFFNKSKVSLLSVFMLRKFFKLFYDFRKGKHKNINFRYSTVGTYYFIKFHMVY